MPYSAGDLNVSIRSSGSGAIKTLDKILERMYKLEGITNRLSSGTTTALSSIGGIGGLGGGKFARSSKNSLFNIAKLGTTYYLMRRIGSAVAKIAQYGADYTETLNLWETAMTRNLDKATQFVDKMNEAYGISKQTLMNAQATFKNMLGSLGQISEATAYALSEGVTQMAIDYASLYNVTFEKAFEKFQSALAGQVRPIRSVSGYDITENTIYELYKQLGGQKSVRNLNRTEKQLLGILAIFNQMQASGAIGDLDKTMESYANQSRVMAEAWKELLSYAGILLTYLIQESKLLTYISASMMFVSDILKGLIEEFGAMQSFGGDIFEGVTDSANDASKATDELKGKLLDFDKFRTLSSGEEEEVAIDQKLLDALAQYQTVLDGASNSARELANAWKQSSDLFDENGMLDINKWNELKTSIENVGTALVVAFAGAEIISGIVGFVNFINDADKALDKLLTIDLANLEKASLKISPLLKLFSNPTFLTIAGIVGALVLLYTTSEDFRESINNLFKSLMPLFTLLFDLVGQILTPLGDSLSGIITFVGKILGFIVTLATSILNLGFVLVGYLLTPLEAIIKVVSTLLTLLETLFTWKWNELGNKLSNLWGNWATINFAESTKNTLSNMQVKPFAEGGLPDKGSMFIAGEAGAEMVYNMPSGQSGVANIQQIAQANYNGTIKALNDWWGGMGAKKDIPQLSNANPTGLYQAVKGVAKQNGEYFSRY